MSRLVLDSITKKFDDGGEEVVAVDNVNVVIEDGQFVVFVGPSGCGKTTTLRCIAGFETPTEGEIILDGEVINGKNPQSRDIAMVFQDYALYPHMSVRGNMSFGLQQSTSMDSDEIANQIEGTAEMLDISELLGRSPGDLSGGQQQRVALGRAIVRDPKVFLMDEPLSNLDAKLRAKMRTYIQQLQTDLSVTTVYVTHDQTEAMTMGDKIAVLNDGRLQQFGTPQECYYQPNNLFVAGFIGEPSMNFFEMEYNNGTLQCETFKYNPYSDVSSKIKDVDKVTLGIRPEQIEIGQTVENHDGAKFSAEISVVEHVGREQYIYFPKKEGEESTFIGIVEGRRSLNSGEKAEVLIPHEGIHLFDADTGESIDNSISEGVMRV